MKFSIIIPTKDRQDVLIATLLSLAKVDYPVENYEVIVVDNGSQDQTLQILKNVQKKIKNLTFLTENNPGVSFARNTGIKHARFPHLIFIDDDVEVKKTFLKGYQLAWQAYPECCAIGGKIRPFLPNRQFSKDQKRTIQKQTWCFSHYDNGNQDRELHLGELLFGPNMSFKKMKEINMFDTRLGRKIFDSYCLKAEEYELCSRLIMQNRKIMYVANPDIEVAHRISVQQFTEAYISSRYYFAGIEHFVMDTILQSKFPNYVSFFKAEIMLRMKQFLSLNSWESIRFFLSRNKWVSIISYFFNGKYFIAIKEK
ncbi:MAG: glycosyltransferase [Patescibacteria group bacterium]